MGYLFTEGRLRPYEAMMQIIPRFTPRQSGVVFLGYCENALDCRYCIHRKGNSRNCTLGVCPFFQERLQAGTVTHDELLIRIGELIDDPALTKRINKILKKKELPSMFFHSEDHKKRFKAQIKRKVVTLQSPAGFASALFLLTTNNCIWQRAKAAVYFDRIDFTDINIGGLAVAELDCYALYKAAKELYTDTRHISISELGDDDIISDSALRTIINSFAVRRYGLKVIK